MEGRSAQLSDPVWVRLARADDVALLAPIEVAAGERFRTVCMDDIADDDPVMPADVAAAALADGRLWVAEVDGSVVGYALALDLDGKPHLEQVSVLPELGGHGVGRALIDRVADWAGEIGGTTLTLATFRDVPWNAPLYQHLGFRILDESEVDDRLLAVRDQEAAHGLDVSIRVFLSRPVPTAD